MRCNRPGRSVLDAPGAPEPEYPGSVIASRQTRRSFSVPPRRKPQ